MGSAEGGKAEVGSEIRWSVWPARERPLAAATVLGSLTVLGTLISITTGDAILGFAAPMFVAASLGSFLTRTDYRLTDEVIEAKTLGVVRSRPWSEMRRWSEDRAGLFLSPFAARHWLDAYRGVRLLFGGNRDQVVAFVERKLGRGDSAPSARTRAAEGGKRTGARG